MNWQRFFPIGQNKVPLGPLFMLKNDENRACVTKNNYKLRINDQICCETGGSIKPNNFSQGSVSQFLSRF